MKEHKQYFQFISHRTLREFVFFFSLFYVKVFGISSDDQCLYVRSDVRDDELVGRTWRKIHINSKGTTDEQAFCIKWREYMNPRMWNLYTIIIIIGLLYYRRKDTMYFGTHVFFSLHSLDYCCIIFPAIIFRHVSKQCSRKLQGEINENFSAVYLEFLNKFTKRVLWIKMIFFILAKKSPPEFFSFSLSIYISFSFSYCRSNYQVKWWKCFFTMSFYGKSVQFKPCKLCKLIN